MALNPRDVKRLLKRLGITDLNLEEVNGVTKVVIYLGDGSTIEVDKPVVTRIRFQGLSIYQVQASDSNIRINKPQIITAPQPRSLIIQPTQQAGAYEPSEDDVKLVMEQTGCSREEAVNALRETNGDIAEAILRIQSRKGNPKT
ncbi:MAG: nascent polypeptide-associated complex protein [Vulcanisaeta sp.]|nr:nascent polypeptide-associated complex protein [Vulcanisaeta sp.]MCG2894776.1 nascent polypeptide-associated complex protein [Vulcanisaeta sp.]